MECSVMFGLTGNLVVVSRYIDAKNTQYILYHDDEQAVWNPADFTEGAFEPALKFINSCAPFEYGGMHYNALAEYDYEKMSKEEIILYMFRCHNDQYEQHSHAYGDNLFWMSDNTVYRLALKRQLRGKIVREPGPLISEVKEFITWNHTIPCRVSISMNGELLHSNAACSKLLYADGTFRDGFSRMHFTSNKPIKCELPEFTLVLDLKPKKFEEIVYIELGRMVTKLYTLTDVTIPEHYQLICPPNSSSIYIMDTDTGEQQLCQFVEQESFYQLLLNIGFEPAPEMKPLVYDECSESDDEAIADSGVILMRHGLYVNADKFNCGYTCWYERSPNAGKFTKAALHVE